MKKENIIQKNFFEENIEMIKCIANKYKINTISIEDLVQEGFLGLLQAEQKFDSTKGVPFSTYAKFWVEKYILDAIRNEIEHTKKLDSLEESNVYEMVEELEKKYNQPTEQNFDLNNLKDLDEIEKKVYQQNIVEQKTFTEIAKSMNVSREKVRQIKQKLLRKLKLTLNGCVVNNVL